MTAITNYISNIDPDISIHQLRELVAQYPFAQAYRVFLASKSENDADCVDAALFGNPFIHQSQVKFVRSNAVSLQKKFEESPKMQNEIAEVPLPDWMAEDLTEDVVEKIDVRSPELSSTMLAVNSENDIADEMPEADSFSKEDLSEPDMFEAEGTESGTPLEVKHMVEEEHQVEVKHQVEEIKPLEIKISGKNENKTLKKLLTDEELSDFVKWLLQQKPLEEAKFLKVKHKFGKKQKKSAVAMEAEKSVQKSEQVASESLAKLLASQGHTEDALSMYKQLSLLYPEKSVYFAVQIENLINNR